MQRNRLLLFIFFVSIMIFVAVLLLANKGETQVTKSDTEGVGRAIESEEENSLSKFFETKEEQNESAIISPSFKKEELCEVAGVTVKEGTVISGETCVGQ